MTFDTPIALTLDGSVNNLDELLGEDVVRALEAVVEIAYLASRQHSGNSAARALELW